MMENPENRKRTYLDDQQLCRSWIKTLEGLRKENGLLLNRLAEALRDVDDPAFLVQAEEFQTRMLEKEEALVLLRHEVLEQLDFLDILPQPLPESPHQYTVLDSDVQKMVLDFNQMKDAFARFIMAW
ncbi:hypothetical protein [Chitinophaga sp. MM2321]|uniref:hypothetical protein n=1 Tax=Chitinophaga sp. MM2321 TaxID=3137178 RepID=UPI0032D57979